MQINLFSTLNNNPILKLLLFILPALLVGLILSSKILFLLILCVLCSVFLALVFKSWNFVYFFSSFAIGLLLSISFSRVKLIQSTDKFFEINSKIYGTVTEVYKIEKDFAAMRIIGTIAIGERTFNDVPLLLTIYKEKDRDTLPKFEVNDNILAIVKLRLPLKTNLPTDISEVSNALVNDVLFFARASEKGLIKHWASQSTKFGILKNIKDNLENRVTQLFEPENVSFFSALLLGNRDFLEVEQSEKFAITGMSHILAISGFHFGIIFSIAFILFSFIRNKWVKFILLSFFLLLYLAVVGFPPSGVRATIMIISFLFANTLERKVSSLNILAFVLLLMMIFAPNLMFSIGFQLSFLAVLGIVLFNKKIYAGIKNFFKIQNPILNFVISIFSVTASTQILIVPVIALYFGYLTFISFFSNIILLPLFSLSLVFGFLALFISIVSINIGRVFAFPADLLLSNSVHINEFLAKTFIFLKIDDNGVVFLAFLFSLLLLWIIFSQNSRAFVIRFLISVLTITLFIDNMRIISKNSVEVYPRAKYVAILIRQKDKNYALIFDRKPHLYPTRDIAMERYLSRLDGDLILGVSGNIGIALSDQVKKVRKISIIEMSGDFQTTVSKILFNNYSLFKL